MRKARITLTCRVCNQEYETHQYRAETSHYCSKECWSHRKTIITDECLFCGTVFEKTANRTKFCSMECAKKFRVGINAPAWKDGKSLERERARLAQELKVWRSAVYARDKYTCQHCGVKGDIHAHHIKYWADYPDLRFEVSNGITLCAKCHGVIHGRDFSNRRHKKCQKCGVDTTGRGKYCRPCSLKEWHLGQGHGPKTLTCKRCGASFETKRPRIFCSQKCQTKARITKITMNCAHCAKPIKVDPYKLKTGSVFYCSETCQHLHSINRVSLICPVCNKSFIVKAYRLNYSKQITCSRECKGKLMSLNRALLQSR